MPNPPLIIGIDEVGRGCIAGPVVAAAVVLAAPIAGVRDSKKLSARRRETLDQAIRAGAAHYALGEASIDEIDTLNILQATFLAMRRAVEALGLTPDQAHLRVDGNLLPPWVSEGGWQAQALVGGDDLEPAIAAASILAKVQRDRFMTEQALVFPGYGFEGHKGYGTAAHLAALDRLGVCPLHRRSFAPVAVRCTPQA